jgi:uncharacterized protein (DUF362 family)/NAD-dependent dihydropyrimidine dehydrogenase PreA subunit
LSKVVVEECQHYMRDSVFSGLRRGIDLLGSIGSFITKGDRVLIKPNMIGGYAPEKAVNSHPVVVEGVAKLVIEAGGIPVIGDSPMFGTARSASKKIGYDKVAEKLNIEIVDFVNRQSYEFRPGKAFKNLKVDRAVVESDKIINIAKLKTHTQMYMTLSVKNMFGSVVGRDKSHWHYIAGRSYETFARLLVELYRFTKPTLNIIDGIVGMQGHGPLSGSPRRIGVLILGADGIAVDRVACEIVGADYERMPIFKANEELGAGVSRLEDIEIIGADISRFMIEDFEFPELEDLNAGILPMFIKNMIRDKVTSRPAVIHENCETCKKCVEVCPASTINLLDNRVSIDIKDCIRCYCCMEACENQAIVVRTPWLSKVVGMI